MVMQILGGKQDALWSMWKWLIPKLSSSEKEPKIQYLESGIRSMGARNGALYRFLFCDSPPLKNPGFQNPRLSWIPLHEPGELVTYKIK